jgi:hypothetical protein
MSEKIKHDFGANPNAFSPSPGWPDAQSAGIADSQKAGLRM